MHGEVKASSGRELITNSNCVAWAVLIRKLEHYWRVSETRGKAPQPDTERINIQRTRGHSRTRGENHPCEEHETDSGDH